MADADDYREPAKTTYVALKEAWEQTGSLFWRLGHSFDSVIDYLATVDRTEASDFAELALTKYLEGGGAWYDDFAWWSIAGLRAAQRTDLFGWRSLDFRHFALDSWKTLDGNAPYRAARTGQPGPRLRAPARGSRVGTGGQRVASDALYLAQPRSA